MANTTFSGPVRSENGFQEWDGTAWVPVAGGGGGGGGGNTAIIFTTPTDGSEVLIQLPAPTTVGTMYTVAGSFELAPNGFIYIQAPLLPGQNETTFYGLLVAAPNTVIPTYGDNGYSASAAKQTTIHIVYLGNVTVAGVVYGSYSVIEYRAIDS